MTRGVIELVVSGSGNREAIGKDMPHAPVISERAAATAGPARRVSARFAPAAIPPINAVRGNLGHPEPTRCEKQQLKMKARTG